MNNLELEKILAERWLEVPWHKYDSEDGDVHWRDNASTVHCECGRAVVVYGEDDDYKACECGRQYRIRVTVEGRQAQG